MGHGKYHTKMLLSVHLIGRKLVGHGLKTDLYMLAQVWIIQCLVLVMAYVRGSGAPECIFHNHHKTLYNIFSQDLAVSCVADKLASLLEI